MEERTEGKHARGSNIVPFSVHNIDEMLEDIGMGVGRAVRFKEWLAPVNPADYAAITGKLLARVGQPSTSRRRHHSHASTALVPH